MAIETKQNDTSKLFSLIKEVEICMLTTETDGLLRSRPMATQQDYNDDKLYFFTKKSSGKVDDIQDEAQVNLAYANPHNQNYISVSGTATLSQDKDKMKRLWNPAYKAWFPEGLDDSEISLLEVTIDRAEYWDAPASKVVHLIGVAKAILTGKAYKPGEHGVVQGLH